MQTSKLDYHFHSTLFSNLPWKAERMGQTTQRETFYRVCISETSSNQRPGLKSEETIQMLKLIDRNIANPYCIASSACDTQLFHLKLSGYNWN